MENRMYLYVLLKEKRRRGERGGRGGGQGEKKRRWRNDKPHVTKMRMSQKSRCRGLGVYLKFSLLFCMLVFFCCCFIVRMLYIPTHTYPQSRSSTFTALQGSVVYKVAGMEAHNWFYYFTGWGRRIPVPGQLRLHSQIPNHEWMNEWTDERVNQK